MNWVKHLKFFMCRTKLALLFLLNANIYALNAFQFQVSEHSAIGSFFKVRNVIKTQISRSRLNLQLQLNSNNVNEQYRELNIAIVGGGPSGLLLAHRILSSSTLNNTNITIFESRSDPRNTKATLEGRAYALGLGIRGRSAIRSVDEELWQCVKSRGYECERFDLHFGKKIKLRLRDGVERRIVKQRDECDVTTNNVACNALEPSVLIYQTDLCSAMVDTLEERLNNKHNYGSSTVQLNFGSIVEGVDVDRKTIQSRDKESSEINDIGPFDLIVGCDGVNSKVRKSMEQIESPYFQSTMDPLPGKFKVVRLSSMPPELDPTSIHAIPYSDGSSAFVEPTIDGACILFATSSKKTATNDIDPLFTSTTEVSYDEIAQAILERFPLLQGIDAQYAAEQIASQQIPSSTYAIKCNIYHYKSSFALVGDAAHATGGVSGQGVNSALQDSIQLVKTLEHVLEAVDGKENDKNEMLSSALLSYSQSQVPEGLALFDASFGPNGLSSNTDNKPTKKQTILYALRNIVDTAFGGRFGIGQPTLQTVMTTTLTPFSEIRRNRDAFYANNFLSAQDWNDTLSSIHEKQLQE